MKSEKIALVTDSTADIPLDLATEYNITIIPTLLIIDGESIEDGSGLSREEFYNSLPDMQPPPTTAAPSSGTFSQAYKHLFSQGYSHLISIHASSLLSGIFNSAKIAASPFGEKIYVIDSKQISTGLGFQVLAGAEAIKRGASIDDILKLITEIRQRIHLIAMLDTLEYVRRSGRVNWVRARLGSMLRIKPFVEVKNGEIISIEQVRTRRIGISRLVEMIIVLGSLEYLAILHSNAETDAHKILSRIENKISTSPLIINITTVIGNHVGPNGLGFAAVVKLNNETIIP